MNRPDLLRLPLARSLLANRWPVFLLRVLALAGFSFAILAGLAGTPVGNRNFSIVFVWILWWAFLILAVVPLLGRGWCTICPIPMPGEWVQNGGLLGPGRHQRLRGLGRRWPKAWRNIWAQNAGFAFLAAFSAVVLTDPLVTGIVLIGLLAVAFGVSLVFERRAFCRYLCPVGGFIGLYSQLSPVELRVKDTAVCAAHTEKTCYTGNESGYGCPWDVFPGGMVKNVNCGLCMECLRTCPHDNIALQVRPFGADLGVPRGRKMDEAFKGFLMLGSAAVYAAVMLGPWGELKTAAASIGSLDWALYVLAYLAIVFLLLPGLFLGATYGAQALSPGRRTLRQRFIAYAYSLIPLGLAAWIAFSLSFVFSNLSYIWPVLSDPLGWGWNLFGTAGFAWTPYLTGLTPLLQTLVLLGGLVWAGGTAHKIAGEAPAGKAPGREAFPIIIYCLFITIGFLWLLVA